MTPSASDWVAGYHYCAVDGFNDREPTDAVVIATWP